MSRLAIASLSALAVALVSITLYRLVVPTDPTAKLFARAQETEAHGMASIAIGQYELLAKARPLSFYAPRALMRAGDLLSAQARPTNDTGLFRHAMADYTQVAIEYPTDPLAIEALQDAAQVAETDLGDRSAARSIYQQLLQRAGDNPDLGAMATLELGHIALDAGDGPTAQSLLKQVIARWPNLPDRAAAAQYYLGMVYEDLFKNRGWASDAYNAVIAHYPTSTWAQNARERMGLILFSDTEGAGPLRRVTFEIPPLPDDGDDTGSIWAALRPLLASRGIAADDSTLAGWSLAPFYAGFNPKHPEETVDPPFDLFQNVVANAGLRFTIQSGGDGPTAQSDLRGEIDAEHLPLVYLSDKTNKYWTLVVGYDSLRHEVMLQNQGARYDTLTESAFATLWKNPSPLGGTYTLLSFVSPTKKGAPAPSLTPAPTPAGAADGASAPPGPPSFTWQLPALPLGAAHLRALRAAAGWLDQPQDNGILLNATALEALAAELARLGAAAQALPVAAPPPAGPVDPNATPTPTPTPAAPAPTPVAPVTDDQTAAAQRASDLLGFFHGPAAEWAMRRRDGAAYLDEAAHDLNDPRLGQAADALRASAAALTAAVDSANTSIAAGSALTEENRTVLQNLATQVGAAAAAERKATGLMRDAEGTGTPTNPPTP